MALFNAMKEQIRVSRRELRLSEKERKKRRLQEATSLTKPEVITFTSQDQKIK